MEPLIEALDRLLRDLESELPAIAETRAFRRAIDDFNARTRQLRELAPAEREASLQSFIRLLRRDHAVLHGLSSEDFHVVASRIHTNWKALIDHPTSMTPEMFVKAVIEGLQIRARAFTDAYTKRRSDQAEGRELITAISIGVLLLQSDASSQIADYRPFKNASIYSVLLFLWRLPETYIGLSLPNVAPPPSPIPSPGTRVNPTASGVTV